MKKRILITWGLTSLLVTSAALATGAPLNLDATLTAQRKLAETRPNDAVTQNDLGNLLELSGDVAGAELAYQKAIELDPQGVAPRFNLALLYQQQKNDRQAIKTLEALLKIDDRHAWAHYQLGVLFEKKKRRNPAIKHYAQAFAIDTTLSFARNNPQILDSTLATESLLLAESYIEHGGKRVPRQFNDTNRIRNLMLTGGNAETKSDAQPAVEPTPKAPPEEGSQAQPAGKAASPTAGATGVSSTGDNSEAATRVLTNEDLKDGSAAAARGSRGRGASTPPQGSSMFSTAPAPSAGTAPKRAPVARPVTPSPAGVYIPQPAYGSQPNGQPIGAPTLSNPGGNPGGNPSGNPAATPPDRFRPSRGSTASLGWQLEPTGTEGAG